MMEHVNLGCMCKGALCNQCKQVKCRVAFKPYEDGVTPKCRQCENENKRSSNKRSYRKNKDYYKQYRFIVRSSSKQYDKTLRQEQRLKVLQHYSSEAPSCDCCNETIIQFLAIDHINGGGNKHAKELRADGTTLYRWLIKNNYPEGFRVLCHNCNLAIGFYGFCPHSVT